MPDYESGGQRGSAYRPIASIRGQEKCSARDAEKGSIESGVASIAALSFPLLFCHFSLNQGGSETREKTEEFLSDFARTGRNFREFPFNVARAFVPPADRKCIEISNDRRSLPCLLTRTVGISGRSDFLETNGRIVISTGDVFPIGVSEFFDISTSGTVLALFENERRWFSTFNSSIFDRVSLFYPIVTLSGD